MNNPQEAMIEKFLSEDKDWSHRMAIAQNEHSSGNVLADLGDFLLGYLSDDESFFEIEKWLTAERILEALCWNKSLSLESVLLLLDKKNFHIGGA